MGLVRSNQTPVEYESKLLHKSQIPRDGTLEHDEGSLRVENCLGRRVKEVAWLSKGSRARLVNQAAQKLI